MWKTGFCIRGLSDFYPQANVQHWDVFHSRCGRIFLPKFSTEKFSTFHSPCGEKSARSAGGQCVRQCVGIRSFPAPARYRFCGNISIFHRHCEGAQRLWQSVPPPLSGRTPHPTRRWRATFSSRRRHWAACRRGQCVRQCVGCRHFPDPLGIVSAVYPCPLHL